MAIYKKDKILHMREHQIIFFSYVFGTRNILSALTFAFPVKEPLSPVRDAGAGCLPRQRMKIKYHAFFSWIWFMSNLNKGMM